MPRRSSEGMNPFLLPLCTWAPHTIHLKRGVKWCKADNFVKDLTNSLTVATNWHANGSTLHSSEWSSGQVQLGRAHQKGCNCAKVETMEI